MTIELDDGLRHVLEREPGQLEPSLGGGRRRLVAGIGDDEDEELVEPELRERRPCERDVPDVRRVEDAAEDPYCHSSSSSPTSTWAPRLIPILRSASSSSSAGGGVPTTR